MTKLIVKGITKIVGITLIGSMVYYAGWFDGHHGVSYLKWINESLDKLEDETQSKRISK